MAMVDECFQIQLINEKGDLDVTELETFAKQVKLPESGISYPVVSIIGPQSSGKSTLLNRLFGTKFRELDAREGRRQTTKGIWLAKCAGSECCTLVMDVEGTDSRDRVDDTAFEKQTALFALAFSNIVIINMWYHDIGREQAANRPLLRTVFEVTGKLFGFRKMTLLFVIRDKATKSSPERLKIDVWEDIRQIWNSIDKPDGHKGTPLEEFFSVEIVALSHYEHKEDHFKEEVASLGQRFFSPVALGKFDGDFPASGFSCSVQMFWKTIREKGELYLPSHKVMVATVCCERIANEKLDSLVANEGWIKLYKDVQSHPVPRFGKKLSSILDSCLLEYDVQTKHFDEGVQKEKRRQFEDKMLKLVKPAYKRMLGHIQYRILKHFKEACQEKLNGSEEFEMAAQDCIKSFMTQYDEGCKDAFVKQANWDSSKERDELEDDMHSHVAAAKEAVRKSKKADRKSTLTAAGVVCSAVLGVGTGVGLVVTGAVNAVIPFGVDTGAASVLVITGCQLITMTTSFASSYFKNRKKEL